MKTLANILLHAILAAFMFDASAIAIIVPEPVEPHEGFQSLALVRQDVDIRIKNDVARTYITQVFYNPHPRQLEATYIFPVPPGSQITDFVMYINGKPVRGEILERAEARRIYEDIVRQMRDPALLEYYDWDVFKMRIFPIPAQGKQKIEIELAQVLKLDNKTAHISFPFSKRDFHQVNVDDLKEWRFDISIVSDKPIGTIYSPSHDIIIERDDEKSSARISIRPETLEKTARNVDIYYSYTVDEYGINILTTRPEPGQDGYFLMIVNPGLPRQKQIYVPKDIIFIIDTSGSMAGEKIEQARNALLYCLENLNKDDRFSIVRFSTDVDIFSEGLSEANKENIARARSFVKELRAVGGTNIHDALRTGLEAIQHKRNDAVRLQQLIFLTDGLPTIGIKNPDEILKSVDTYNASHLRIFVLGVGYDVNTRLLDALAGRTRAFPTYIEPDEDLEIKVSSLYDKISRPVMTDMKIDFGDIEVKEVYPRVIPDLFAGSEITIMGRYRNSGHTGIILRGREWDKERTLVYECTFPEREPDNRFIEPLWATRKVAYLLDEIREMQNMGRLEGVGELVVEVTRLGKKYGIVTPYTSYLIQEDETPPNIITHRRSEGLRGDVRFWGESSAPVAGQTTDMGTYKGRAAVEQSKSIARMKESVKEPAGLTEKGAVFVNNKSLTFGNGVWLDRDVRESSQTTITIKFLSAAYFELLDIRQDMLEVFRLGERIKIQLKPDVILSIDTEGLETLTPEIKRLLAVK